MGDPASVETIVRAFRRSADLVIAVDVEGRVLASSREGELDLSRGLFEILAEREEVARAHDRAMKEGTGQVIEASAGDRCLRVSITPFDTQDGVVLVDTLTDITENKRAEERARRSESMMVDAQGLAHLGTWEWDIREAHAVWSTELYRIYGLSPERYTPTYEAYLQMVHPDDREYVKAATERVFVKHEPYSHDERIIRADGAIRYLHTWAFPIVGPDGRLERLVGVCQDITDRKTAELALERQNERLREEIAGREQVETKLRQAHKLEAIGRLAGGIAHDFNNLLCVILVRNSMVQARLERGSPLLEHVEEIATVARQSARLTQQLLAFSREQVSRDSVNDLAEIVATLTEMLRRTTHEDIAFNTRIDVEEDAFVKGDKSPLEQVVMNLVLNARDAMPSGGTLTLELFDAARLEQLPEELDASRRYVVLSVTDTGVGMAENVRQRAFDPYFTTKETGHGLGLSTVYGIVRQCGGTVQIESTLGKGSRIRVYLPRARRADDTTGTLAPKGDLRGSATLLLVEDEESLRRMLTRYLGDLGYEVIEATSADDALALLSSGKRPHLVVTDVVMPRISGLELVKRAREMVPSIRALYISGWSDASLVAELQRETNAFLQKPFLPEALALAVRAVLREG